MSFFPIKDSFGTTQLVVFRKKDGFCDLSAMSDVPVESTVLVEGQVRLRPEKDQRPVSVASQLCRHAHLCD
jgi:aspartyl-tRNA synthetase